MAENRIDPAGLVPSTSNGDVLTTAGGVAQWGGSRNRLVPWTTTVNGVPDLVWDSNDELVLIEVSL